MGLKWSAAASGMALMTTFGGLGGFASSLAMGMLKQTTGSYTSGMTMLAVALTMSAAIILALGRTMTKVGWQPTVVMGQSRRAK